MQTIKSYCLDAPGLRRGGGVTGRHLVRRSLWIGSNLVAGYYATLGTLLIVLVWVDDEISGFVFRLLCTFLGLGFVVGIGSGLNALLRLFNRDLAVRRFWIISMAAFSAWSVYFLLVVVLLEQQGMFPIFWN